MGATLEPPQTNHPHQPNTTHPPTLQGWGWIQGGAHRLAWIGLLVFPMVSLVLDWFLLVLFGLFGICLVSVIRRKARSAGGAGVYWYLLVSIGIRYQASARIGSPRRTTRARGIVYIVIFKVSIGIRYQASARTGSPRRTTRARGAGIY